MKSKTRIVSLMSVGSLLGGLAVSCSGGGKSVNDTIYFWNCSGAAIQTALEEKASDFMNLVQENEGKTVKIVIQNQGSDYTALRDKVTKSFATGNTPTMTVAYPDHVANYIDAGETRGEYTVNLDDYINNEDYGFGTEAYLGDDKGVDDIVPAFFEEGQKYVLDGTYSMPFMKSTEVMFYNKNLVSAVFAEYMPTVQGSNIDKYLSTISWDELMDLCEYIVTNKDKFVFGNNITVPCIYDSDANMFVSQMLQSGLSVSSIVDGNGQLDFNTPEAKDLIADLKADYDKGLFATKGTLGEYGSNFFTDGECLFSIGSSGGTGYNAPQSGAFEVGVVKVPPRENNPLYVTQGLTLTLLKNGRFTDAENEELIKYAWKFMKYMINTQNNVDLCLASEGYVPVRQSSYETDDYSQYLEEAELLASSAKVVINDINGHYLSTPVFKGSATLRTEGGNIITSVMLGTKTVDEAFEYAVNEIKLMM